MNSGLGLKVQGMGLGRIMAQSLGFCEPPSQNSRLTALYTAQAALLQGVFYSNCGVRQNGCGNDGMTRMTGVLGLRDVEGRWHRAFQFGSFGLALRPSNGSSAKIRVYFLEYLYTELRLIIIMGPENRF